MFTEEKLNKIKQGVNIKNRTIKFWAAIINKQSSNTWVHIKSNNNSVIDIRNVFSRLSLRVNRIIRTDYGPFTLGVLRNPGEVTETNIPRELNSLMYQRMKEKTQLMIRKLDDTKLEKAKNDLISEQRRLKKLNHQPNDEKKILEKVESIKLI